MTWEEIKELYEKAGECLWNSKKAEYWSIDYENGLYYLLAALREARQMPEKDHLAFARILSSCALNRLQVIHDFEIFTKYLQPAYEEYQSALKGPGEKPTEKELECFNRSFEHWKFRYDNEANNGEKYGSYLANIEGGNLMNERNISFYDAHFVAFELDDKRNSAVLRLSYDGEYLITVLFSGIHDARLNCDSGAEYVGEFHCYRDDRFPPSLLIFSVGFLEVTCSRIEIVSVEDTQGSL